MRQVIVNNISARSLNFLKKKQDKINNVAFYQKRCELAKKKWEEQDKIRVLAFQEIKIELITFSPLCHYCEKEKARDIEHIFPKSLYPNKVFVWENYVYACGECNQSFKRDNFAIFIPASSNTATDILIGKYFLDCHSVTIFSI